MFLISYLIKKGFSMIFKVQNLKCLLYTHVIYIYIYIIMLFKISSLKRTNIGNKLSECKIVASFLSYPKTVVFY